MQKWIITAFATIGAIVSCGLGGAVIASALGYWELPIATFCAAFSGIYLIQIAAPQHGQRCGLALFILADALAWLFLKADYYPDRHAQMSQWNLPLLSSFAGGLLALLAGWAVKPEKTAPAP
jgi:hypothetical protein